jgi:hypothetical protein
MENASRQGEERRARRRRRKARRRSWVIAAVVIALAAALAVAMVVAGRGPAPRADDVSAPRGESSSASQGGAASASPAPPDLSSSPTPSPSSTPIEPPLERPTKKHPLRVYFGGDSLAGLPGVLFAQQGAQSGLMKVHTDYQVSSRLTSTDPVDWPAHLKAQLAAGHPDVGVFMIGINDPGMPMIAKGDYTSYPERSWLTEYQHRAETLMLMMLHEGAKRVYWVGLPVMPENGQTNQVKRLNRLFEDAAAKHPQVVYVDTFELLATEKGGFDASLRSGDGTHFTNEGAWRIADAVRAAMKRDWRPAE